LKISTQNPTPQSKSAFTAHLKETKEQLVRLNRISTKLGKPFTGHTCAAMKGIIEEGSEWMPKKAAPQVMDAALIAAQRVDHYEMAGYGTVHNSSESCH
jgi:ferritin-like metal-binding protein YciE